MKDTKSIMQYEHLVSKRATLSLYNGDIITATLTGLDYKTLSYEDNSKATVVFTKAYLYYTLAGSVRSIDYDKVMLVKAV